ncbi:ficolin-2-like [Drosophila innubila]|uniref:ficolin-2-like n=1 Tax=Drosophila innubila TaxID=198719 RepID=UPI00148E5707|nr:ficolin-2-like [Drosophila innubila]
MLNVIIEIMMLRIIAISTILLLGASVLKCDEDHVPSLDKLGNLTIKYGNTTEIRFNVKDTYNKLLQAQYDVMRMEQIRQGGLLDDLVAKFNKLTSLEPSQFPGSCAEATALSRRTGVYQIVIPDYSVHPFIVSCDEDSHGGGWTIVMRRHDGSVDFYLFWKHYKNGFGNVNGEFFIGLEKLHIMTKELDQELLIMMEDFKGQKRFARYNRFVIDSEQNEYALKVLGEYSGDAGDSLIGHAGRKFTAQDRDNDENPANCATQYTGAWWYSSCHSSNLLGKYNDNTFGKGINWLTFTTHTASLKNVQMMIRPRRS